MAAAGNQPDILDIAAGIQHDQHAHRPFQPLLNGLFRVKNVFRQFSLHRLELTFRNGFWCSLCLDRFGWLGRRLDFRDLLVLEGILQQGFGLRRR